MRCIGLWHIGRYRFFQFLNLGLRIFLYEIGNRFVLSHGRLWLFVYRPGGINHIVGLNIGFGGWIHSVWTVHMHFVMIYCGVWRSGIGNAVNRYFVMGCFFYLSLLRPHVVGDIV